MKVLHVVSADCPPCRLAEVVWRKACADARCDYEQVDLGSPAGERLREAFDLRTLPAVVIGDRLVAVGVQTPAEARELLRGARQHDPAPGAR